MTAIMKKENLKNRLLKEYHSLKNFMNFSSTDEESIISLLEHLAENLFYTENSSCYRKNLKNYNNYQIKNDLKQERNSALYTLVLHKGLFF